MASALDVIVAARGTEMEMGMEEEAEDRAEGLRHVIFCWAARMSSSCFRSFPSDRRP
jgi:hypothetical protein